MAFNRQPTEPTAYRVSHPSTSRPIKIGLKTVQSDATERTPILDSLVVGHVDRALQKARGETRLFFSGVSAGFIHGPDTLIPMVEIARKLLDSGEEITSIREAQFREIVRSELALVATTPDQISKDELAQAAVILKVTTNQGRLLTITGTALPTPVAGGQWVGRIAAVSGIFGDTMVETIKTDCVERRYLTSGPPTMSGRDIFSPAIQLATFFDLALQAGGNMMKKFAGAQMMLAAGCKKMTIPNLANLEEDGLFTIELQDPLVCKKRFSFGVLKTTLITRDAKEIASATIEIAMPNSKLVADVVTMQVSSHPLIR